MSSNLDFWSDCYTEGNTGWDRGETHPSLIRLLEEGGLEPSEIIVPGCGRGYEVIELARRGFEVTGIDFAEAPVQQLRSRLKDFRANAEVVKGNIFEYQPPGPVDAVYEQTCLCAIDPKMRPQYEQAIFSWLRPGGILFALFAQKAKKPNEGPPFHCDLDDMALLFPASRWKWDSSEIAPKFEHPGGGLFEIGMKLTRIP